jgi:hypothetical protein
MMLRPKSLIEIKETFVFSSDVDSGAKNKSELGDYFQVQLNNPLTVPADALNCNIRVLQSSIWYTTPNISTVQNNNTIYYNDGVADKTIVLPNGLYGIDDINLVLARELVANGDATDLFTLLADNATQRVVILFNAAGVTIDFTQPNTPRDILGFNDPPVVIGPSVVGGGIPGNAVAGFNSLEAFVISGDIVSNGIPTNSIARGVLAFIPITAEVGLQNVYSPFNPLMVDGTELIGKSKNVLNFYLTDQNLRPLDTNSENWSFIVELSYQIPVLPS